MGTKSVCFACRKAFNRHLDSARPIKCPDCGQPVRVLSHRFRPPKKRETVKWELAKYLVDHGFYYQHIMETATGGKYVRYPETRQKAEEFVKVYHAQAVK